MIWIVQRGLDKYDGRKDTGSKQASKQVKRKSALFPVELKTAQKQKAYSVRFTTDGMRFFVFARVTKI